MTLKPFQNFSVDLSSAVAKEELSKIQSDIESINSRILDILTKASERIQPQIPIFQIILSNFDSEDIKLIAKVLERIATLQEPLKDLNQKKNAISMVTEDPNWFFQIFGDFSNFDSLSPSDFT